MVQHRFTDWTAPIESLWTRNGISIHIKRDDLMDPLISGNKIFKLKENINAFHNGSFDTLVTFGGAYSNHIAATAALCQEENIACVGIIRGERIEPLNPTLAAAEAQGMKLMFVSRSVYRIRNNSDVQSQLLSSFPSPYCIPEGGANRAGIVGASAMLNEATEKYSHIITAVGTGTTLAGMALQAKPNQELHGMVIHKHLGVMEEVLPMHEGLDNALSRVRLHPAHYGGYAKWDESLLQFIRSVFNNYGVRLDPIYTGKALFSLNQLVNESYFPEGAEVLFIHTGGLQAIPGFEARFGIKVFE
ncbi:MAG: pyridoxal-phosphate dependent enzyme [Cryomorphaceae bacterium]